MFTGLIEQIGEIDSVRQTNAGRELRIRALLSDLTAGELVQAGYDPGLVRRVVTLVDRAEYKRRQAPPGVRVTPKAFGKDRRLPITNRYTG